MRIVIDFQGAQTDSRYRGIGHYSTEFVKSLIRQCPTDDFFLVLNGLFSDSIEPIRAQFDGILPQENIRVWYTPGPIEHFSAGPGNLREIAETMREYYLRSLDPDLILITSVFEGLSNDAVVTVKKHVKDVPVAAIFYDFTPLYMPDEQFRINPVYRRWYRERIDGLRRCDLLFAISESSRQEVIEQVGFDPTQVVNVLGGRNESFTRRTYSEQQRLDILQRLGITKPFILYTGGLEPNKNLKRLVEALSYLPGDLTDKYQFVCVGKRNPGEIEQIQAFARDAASLEMIKTVGFVPQSELIDLYNLCDLFVFPSLREGFGLPPLEAMACGAPTIVSDQTSLPEVVANSDALFDPYSPTSIADKIIQALCDARFRKSLVERGLERASGLTWDATASKACRDMHMRFQPRRSLDRSRRTVFTRTGLFKPARKRIVVQKLDHHGDFLLGLPAMAKLRARYPNAEIHALLGSWNIAAAQASGLFNEIHSLDFFKSKSSLSAEIEDGELQAALGPLPFYDYAIDLRRQPDTRFILTELNAYRYFGYRTGDAQIDQLLTSPLEIHPDAAGERSYFDETHTCEQMLRIVDTLPFDPNDYVELPDLGPRLPVRPGSVAIFPKVGNDSRQWHSEYFERLIHSLASDPAVSEVNLFCGAARELDDITVPTNSKIRVHAGLTFADLFSALSANSVCIGNNSLGVHLAGYAGCRTIGIYSGHELPQQWGPPFGDSVAITVDAHCSPCHLPDRASCPHELFCLGDISVETVASAVSDALAGKPLLEDYSRFSRDNPASAVKPLVDAVNKSKFMSRIDGLTSEQRLAFAAAVSINFPERISSSRHLLLDVSGLLEGGQLGHSNRRLKHIRELVAELRKRAYGRILLVATGPHDHEFYEVDVEHLEQSLFMGNRSARVVRPMAGDIYIGAHPYLSRNPAQWELLASWRQLGVFTILSAPKPLDFDALINGDDHSQRLASYGFKIAHFDAVIAAEDDCEPLKDWFENCGPPRRREIKCSAELMRLIDDYVRGDPTNSSRRGSVQSGRPGNARRVRRLLVEVAESGDERPVELLKRNGID